jgi:hypothetical protein
LCVELLCGEYVYHCGLGKALPRCNADHCSAGSRFRDDWRLRSNWGVKSLWLFLPSRCKWLIPLLPLLTGRPTNTHNWRRASDDFGLSPRGYDTQDAVAVGGFQPFTSILRNKLCPLGPIRQYSASSVFQTRSDQSLFKAGCSNVVSPTRWRSCGQSCRDQPRQAKIAMKPSHSRPPTRSFTSATAP